MGSRLSVLKQAAQRTGLSFEEYQAKVAAGEKWCTGCKDWHSRSQFVADASRWDGLKATCGAHGRVRYRETYVPRPRPAAGRRFRAARNDDRKQARGRVNHLVNIGILPNPNDVPCADCGHLDPARSPRHEYDHHLGYAPEHHEDVEPVCAPCHRRRTNSRRTAAQGVTQMSDGTEIAWTDATWNTITGCTRVSEGCERCYIDRTPPFRMAHRRFDSPRIGGTTGVILHEDRLTLPLSWRKPRRIFVNSLSDLFHEAVPTEHIAKVFATMALTPQHTYQILTKRPARMRAMLALGDWQYRVHIHANNLLAAQAREKRHAMPWSFRWPLPNVWLGVSTETQHWAENRVPMLLETPAAVRFISAEPLLGEIRLDRLKRRGPSLLDALNGDVKTTGGEVYASAPASLDWVIVGGESGPGARPMDSLWAMDLVVQCSARGVPMFVKQLGAVWARENGAADRKGGDPAEWPKGLRERNFPSVREAVSA